MNADAHSARTVAEGSAPRWLRRLGIAIAGLMVAVALLLLLLRVVLAGMPSRADRVKAWVERQTQLRLEFSRLDARLRWYGPELVLQELRLLDRDSRQPMLAMREGSVALDLWNVLRSGEFVAGRVSFVGPTVTVLRLEDGSFRLLGLDERPADRPPFDFDRLPAGHVQIADATVQFRDLKARSAPWTLHDVDVVLRRDRDRVVTRGSARLPESLGTRVGFEAELLGTLAAPRDLVGRVDFEAERIELAGLTGFLPPEVATPFAGTGRVNARVAFGDRQLTELRLDLQLRGLALRVPARIAPTVDFLELTPPHRLPGGSPLSVPVVDQRWRQQPVTLPATVSYNLLAGQLELRRLQDGWAFELADLRAVQQPRRAGPSARLSGEFHGRPVSRHSLVLNAHQLRLDELWPLAVALAPRSADRWLGLAPQGEIRTLAVSLNRPRAGATPEFSVDADVADLGVAASGASPGLRGLTATVSGSHEHGRIALRSPTLEFEWPSMFVAAPGPVALTGDLSWRREGASWIVGGEKVSLEHPQARAKGAFEFRYPGGARSPVLRADATLERVDAALVRAMLPYGRLKPRSIGWLKPAFVQGTAVDGIVRVDGPLREFPFRNGGGEFRIAFDVRDVTLDYAGGFTPLSRGAGQVVIENGGLHAELGSGRVGGLALERGAVTITDLKAPVVDIDAAGRGDLGDALGLLQGSPLGPVIGRQFMQLAGRGDTEFGIKLHLPTREMESRDHEVRVRLEQASVSLPLLRVPAQDISGELIVRRREIASEGLRGTFLGGPFTLAVTSGAAGGPEFDSVSLQGGGRASGTLLPAFIGLPAGLRMSGGADWTLGLNARRQGKGEPWSTQLAVASDLRGLAIDAPPPFAKGEEDARPTALTLDSAADGGTDVDVRSGAARARLAFRDRGGKLEFERGALRFDDGALALPASPGLQIDGDWPDFDLAQWLAIGGDEPARRALSDWLGPVNVRLARARLFGYELRDVSAQLAALDRSWQVDLAGPYATGRVTVPFDLKGGAPVRLDMQRLQLESGATAEPRAGGRAADPRRIPPLSVSAAEFIWQGRRLGQLEAEIVREALGLRLRKLTATSPALEIAGTGRWIVEGSGSRSELDIAATSTDLATAAAALGYRDAIEAGRAQITARLTWPGGPTADAVRKMDGRVRVELDDGQLRNVEPGATGRVLGLMSVIELPRRLALDFRDVTDEGLAFDSVRGDFELRKGNAYTQNLLLTGAAVDIGVAGRTGLASQDYDQTVIVSGNPGGPLTVAGALAAGPVVGAGVLVLSQLFKGQLKGLTRAYYRVTGPWSAPVVERISAPAEASVATEAAAAAVIER